MSLYWNTRTKHISPYVPGEQPKDKKFIKLNTNENPYPPSPLVIKAIKDASDDNLRLYPDPECSKLREVAASRCGVKPEQVFAGNGSDEILAFAFGAFFEKTILFPEITYSFYPVYADLWDIPYSMIPLRGDFTINIKDFRIPSDGVVLSNPNAPTGIALALDDILSLAEFTGRLNKVLIVDEAYIAFGAQSAVNHIDKFPNMLITRTLSKSASLAGLRAGYAIGSAGLIEGLRRIRDSFNSYTLDRLALAGAEAAVKDEAYYNDVNSRVIAARDRVSKSLSLMGFQVLPSSANFILIRFPGLSGGEFFLKLREKGILVRHFNKDKIADFLRVSIGLDEEMDIFLSVCKNILGENNENH
ncbi:MAG: histidinol-phosphate transaminase [Treponema sp.]|nr:histidinol-phosphate transaminase [Treponema sp.]